MIPREIIEKAVRDSHRKVLYINIADERRTKDEAVKEITDRIIKRLEKQKCQTCGSYRPISKRKFCSKKCRDKKEQGKITKDF